MARYIVTATKFDCVDESGLDLVGSDEPYWVFTANSAGKVTTSHSEVFGDVDSDETRAFRQPRTVWPAKGNTAGAEGPIGLSIQLWESDQGQVEDVKTKTEAALTLAQLAPKVGAWAAAARPIVREFLNLFGDDLMGSRTLLWTKSRLTQRLPEPGASFTVKHRFGGRSGDIPVEIAGGPDYDLYLQVTRVA
jgi:hypothetical protein